MPENDRLSGCLEEIGLGLVEREATPRLPMKLSIQRYLAGLSLSNTVFILEMFDGKRVRSTAHNCSQSRFTARIWSVFGSRCGRPDRDSTEQ